MMDKSNDRAESGNNTVLSVTIYRTVWHARPTMDPRLSPLPPITDEGQRISNLLLRAKSRRRRELAFPG